ncbi:hypothetical protein UFOVP314_50 [uncultured Caudovirales phage]|uniref:Uncharacterized protein n=1 Tax=uncultured Caudovirales phage TaxID=2100421 RepID=A0A6J5LT40_9CAUD|nr:hypothetical protein UFOVP314_50 [uncultured Caudovirales phage]
MIADWIPTVVRKRIYELLVAAYGLELVFDWVSGDVESKLLAAAGVLGFAIARANTGAKPVES